MHRLTALALDENGEYKLFLEDGKDRSVVRGETKLKVSK